MTELSPETRALLAAAELPPMPAERRERLKRAVVAQIAAGTAGLTTSAAITKSGGSLALGAKIAVATVVMGVAVGAGVVWSRPDAPPARTSATPAVSAAPVSASAPPVPDNGAPSASPAVEPRPPVPLENVLDAPPRAHSAGRLSGAEPLPPSRWAANVKAVPSSSDGEPHDPSTLPAPDVSAAPRSALMLEDEARLLRSAHQALEAGDAGRALALLDEHAARFPRGVLEPERSAERVLALCRAGRATEARAEGQRFLAVDRPPHLAARVRSSCAGSEK